MARKEPERGYFLKDGLVSHAVLERGDGQRITEEEARALAGERRAQAPKAEAGPAIDWSRVEALESKVDGIINMLRELPSVVKGG